LKTQKKKSQLLVFLFLVWINILLFYPQKIQAQASEFVDSIAQSFKQKPSFTAFWGSRNAFIANRRAQMTSYNIGVDFGKNLTVGGGFNLLMSPLFEKDMLLVEGVKLPVFKKWNINYMGYFIEYTFYNTRRWKFSIPVQAGWGLTYRSFYLNEKIIREDKQALFIYEPTMSGTYRITRYFGVGADVGYRLVFNKNKPIGRLTSPIYVFSFKIFYSRLYNDIKTKFGLKLP